MASTPEAEGGIPLRLRVMGVTVDASAPDEETRARLARQWSRAVLEDDAEVGTLVRGPAATTGDPESFERRDYYFTTEVTLAGLLATAGKRVNLHAGSVANDAGRVLVVVGPSGTGKTTATRALAARLHYLSDETASISPDGVVFPHPKPLSIVTRPDDHTHKEQLSPDDIGLGSTPESGSLHRIVLLHRGEPTRHGLQPLDTATALMELIEQSSSLASLDAPLTTLLDVMDSTGGVLALEYAEITDHVDELIGLLDEVETAREPATRLEPVRHPGSIAGEPPDVPPGDDRLHRLPWTDAIELGADLVVLLETRAVRLSELAATVWLHLDEPRTVAELVTWAQEVHGTHPDATVIVEQAVDALTRESLVVGGSMS